MQIKASSLRETGSRWVGLVLLLAGIPGQSMAQTVALTKVGQWYADRLGASEAVISGDHAYLAANGLQVLDISDPVNPVWVGGTNSTGSLRSVAVQGDYAYAIEGEARLRIINISNPTNPIPAGTTDLTGSAGGDVAVSGSYAYVLAGGFLQIIDISDPANPKLVGETNAGFGGVAVSGNYAYVATSSSLQVFDVSNPAPVLVGNITDPQLFPGRIAISGNYAYVSSSSLQPEYVGLQVFDLSDPANPVHVGSFQTTNTPTGLAISGSYAYLTVRLRRLEVIDISDPVNPVGVGRYDSSAFSSDFNSIVVSGNHVYAHTGASGLEIIDVTNPTAPAAVKFIPITGSVQGVALSGQYAYLADGNSGLAVIDVSNPASPVRVGGFFNGRDAQDVAMSGSYACVLNRYQDLQVIDISTPANPQLVGTCQITNFGQRIVASGNYVFVSFEYGHDVGLQIIDVSTPTNPVTTAVYWVPGRAESIHWNQAGALTVAGNYVFLGYGGTLENFEFGPESFGGVEVIDVSNPANPVYAGEVPLYGYQVVDVAVSGNYAYAIYYRQEHWMYGGPYGGLAVSDVSNPASPWLRSFFQTGQMHTTVSASGNYAFMDTRVFDVSNPTNVVLASNLGNFGRLAFSGNYIHVPNRDSLLILSLNPRLFAERLGTELRLKWPTSAGNYLLESAANLSASQWQLVGGTPMVQDGFRRLTVPATNSAAFFRLRQP